MTPWRVVITRPAEKDLRGLPDRDRDAVARAIDRLSLAPGEADIRKLAGRGDEWRLRVGRWRVRFVFDAGHHAVVVIRVLPRSTAYRD